MKKSKFIICLAAVFIAAGTCLLVQAADRPSRTPRPVPGKNTNSRWIVIQIGEDFKVIQETSLNDENKRLADDYKQKMKEWRDMKKSDPKAERPPKLAVKVRQKGFETQKGAQEYCDMLMEKEGKGDKKNPMMPGPWGGHGRRI